MINDVFNVWVRVLLFPCCCHWFPSVCKPKDDNIKKAELQSAWNSHYVYCNRRFLTKQYETEINKYVIDSIPLSNFIRLGKYLRIIPPWIRGEYWEKSPESRTLQGGISSNRPFFSLFLEKFKIEENKIVPFEKILIVLFYKVSLIILLRLSNVQRSDLGI